MQIVYISNRVESLRATLPYVKAFMPFVTEVVVFSPAVMKREFERLDGLTVIDEATLLNPSSLSSTASVDHQLTNYRLRAGLASHPYIADHFIMSDDDSRPIVPITSNYYVENGKFHSYFFYTLDKWKSMVKHLPLQTSFDLGHIEELRLLKLHAMQTLMFSSHMPQVVDKEMFGESVSFFAGQMQAGHAISEWGSYFNFAQTKHPERFHQPSVFRTLAWPECPYQWPWQHAPAGFDFENFYPSLYDHGGLFHGLDHHYHPERHWQHILEKVRRYTERSTKAKLQRAAEKSLMDTSQKMRTPSFLQPIATSAANPGRFWNGLSSRLFKSRG